MVDLRQQRRAPALLVHARADMAVEVAIGTLGLAERPVDIDGEAVRGRWIVHSGTEAAVRGRFNAS
jgi:hypothetical protein